VSKPSVSPSCRSYHVGLQRDTVSPTSTASASGPGGRLRNFLFVFRQQRLGGILDCKHRQFQVTQQTGPGIQSCPPAQPGGPERRGRERQQKAGGLAGGLRPSSLATVREAAAMFRDHLMSSEGPHVRSLVSSVADGVEVVGPLRSMA
jgi:hypothetical protein